MTSTIDFVIPWVDGNDLNWRNEKNRYKNNFSSEDEERFRDWELLKYWFRGVDRFAPWVNKIHFITWGHLPEWLNTSHPKLNIVRHEDFIPKEFLPTFSSHIIEIYLHRIKGLSQNFVYFNDDMFLIKGIKQDMFFKNDLPCDEGIFHFIVHNDYENDFPHHLLNMVGIINKHFNFKNQIAKHQDKFITSKYGPFLHMNEFYCQGSVFPGLYTMHLPQAFNKEVFEEVWNYEGALLKQISSHKFRHIRDVHQYLFRYWQVMKGDFEPILYRKIGWVYYYPEKEINEIELFIRNQERSIICINDSKGIENFEKVKIRLQKVFEEILPEKSNFEL